MLSPPGTHHAYTARTTHRMPSREFIHQSHNSSKGPRKTTISQSRMWQALDEPYWLAPGDGQRVAVVEVNQRRHIGEHPVFVTISVLSVTFTTTNVALPPSL